MQTSRKSLILRTLQSSFICAHMTPAEVEIHMPCQSGTHIRSVTATRTRRRVRAPLTIYRGQRRVLLQQPLGLAVVVRQTKFEDTTTCQGGRPHIEIVVATVRMTMTGVVTRGAKSEPKRKQENRKTGSTSLCSPHRFIRVSVAG